MKRILLITTGGTIGSGSSSSGTRPKEGANEVLRRSLGGLKRDGKEVCVDTLELLKKDSTNINVADQFRMAHSAFEALNYMSPHDGAVITHGTDTLHFTSSMLSFFLRETNKPIVLTGSMRTLEQPESDAVTNLRGAINFAMEDVGGVFVVFNNKVMRGRSVYESHPGDINGFTSPEGPIATIEGNKVTYGTNYVPPKLPITSWLRTEHDSNIVSIPLVPGTTYNSIKIFEENSHGLVLVGYGSFGIPEHLRDDVKKLAGRMPVVLTAATPNTVTKPGDYEVSRAVLGTDLIMGTGLMPFDYANLVFTLGHFHDLSGVPASVIKKQFEKDRAEVLKD